MLRFDRADFVLTRWIIAAVAVATPVFLLVVPVLRWVAGAALTWQSQTGMGERSLAPLLRARDGARLTWDGQASVRIDHASAGLWLASLLPGLVIATAVAVVAILVWRVLGEIQAGRPFTTRSLRALRTTGLVIAATAVVHPLVDGAVTALVMGRAVAGRPIGLSVAFSPLWLLGGMLVLAVAEAFRVGVRLTDDVEGLV